MGRMWCHSLTSMLFHSVLFSSLFCSFLFSVKVSFSPFSSSCHPLHALFLCLCGRGTPVCLFTFHLFISSFICPLSLSISLSLSLFLYLSLSTFISIFLYFSPSPFCSVFPFIVPSLSLMFSFPVPSFLSLS